MRQIKEAVTDSSTPAYGDYLEAATSESEHQERFWPDFTNIKLTIIFPSQNNFVIISGKYEHENEISDKDREFEEQKMAFLRIPQSDLNRYHNQFVVSHNGRILDSDEDLPTLTGRVFERHGDIAIYATKINGEMEEVFSTPFFE